jgi:DnaK suppressor protein
MTTQKQIQTPFDDDTLTYFKEKLLNHRADAEEQVEELQRNLSNLTDLDDADYSSISHHMGDVGSDTEEAELSYQLLERTKKYINQINDALARIENGTYGICQATGKVIAKERLDAVPHTRYSMEAKKKGLAEE